MRKNEMNFTVYLQLQVRVQTTSDKPSTTCGATRTVEQRTSGARRSTALRIFVADTPQRPYLVLPPVSWVPVCLSFYLCIQVTDQGFPKADASLRRGAPTYYFGTFLLKLYENVHSAFRFVCDLWSVCLPAYLSGIIGSSGGSDSTGLIQTKVLITLGREACHPWRRILDLRMSINDCTIYPSGYLLSVSPTWALFLYDFWIYCFL